MATYGEVLEVQRLTPRMIRVVLGGEGLADYVPVEETDQYVNALFIPDGAPYSVPFDVAEARQLPPEHRPMGRRYTIRWWDQTTRQIALDFVVHGDVGVAGRWANHARPGDLLQFTGPSGGFRPDPDADVLLMVGDESALPAIGASLQDVTPGQRVQVVAVVDGTAHELSLESPGNVTITWVHRNHTEEDDGRLVRAVAALDLPPGRVQAFVHGEAGEVRAVRKHLLADRGFTKEDHSISPYWRRNMTDEGWRQVKKQWLAESETDI